MLKNVFGFADVTRHKKLILAGTALLIVLLFAAIYLSMQILNNPRVYSGVYLDGVHLGGLDKAALSEYLEQKYEFDASSTELRIYHKEYPVTLNFSEFNAYVDRKFIMDQIYQTGRTGNTIQRLKAISQLQKNPLYLETDVSMNMNAVDRVTSDIFEKTFMPSNPPSLLILEDGVYLYSGTCGYAVNREELKKRIVEGITTLKSNIVIVPVDKVLPVKIDIDSFYNQIVTEPQEASVTLVNGNINITPERIGRSLDKASFLSSVAEMEAKPGNYPYEIKLPVTFINPEKTVESIEAVLLKDELSTYSTAFPVNTEQDKKRSVNIRLAVEAIDGTLLLPGETFSFNEIVGMRTKNRGYRVANVYSSSGIIPGIGGGICQVSSTLYNAALEANMKIDERNPHIYTVAYVPLGRDAAVSYGTQDFCFTNSTDWPVKITGGISGNQIQFTLIGTNENPSLKVYVQPTVVKVLPYTTEYVEVKNTETSTDTMMQAGMDGAVVETFFTLRSEKNVVSSYKLHTTTYQPLPEIVHVPPGNIP